MTWKIIVPDWLVVKKIERRLGRKLTEDEIHMAMEQDEDSPEVSGLSLHFPDGSWELINLPKLFFPDDFTTKVSDL